MTHAKGFLFNDPIKSFHPKMLCRKRADLQQAWKTCGSQLTAQTFSLMYLNEAIPILYTRNIKLEATRLEGTLGIQLVHPSASGWNRFCVNMSCQIVSALRNLWDWRGSCCLGQCGSVLYYFCDHPKFQLNSFVVLDTPRMIKCKFLNWESE